mmetsp:Transcript_13873/g.38144  ORF Transcript_13873/g.38144 Transcript_13873/m.38144 type:complete len:133 (-) Transcript_13873:134-532(-)
MVLEQRGTLRQVKTKFNKTSRKTIIDKTSSLVKMSKQKSTNGARGRERQSTKNMVAPPTILSALTNYSNRQRAESQTEELAQCDITVPTPRCAANSLGPFPVSPPLPPYLTHTLASRPEPRKWETRASMRPG